MRQPEPARLLVQHLEHRPRVGMDPERRAGQGTQLIDAGHVVVVRVGVDDPIDPDTPQPRDADDVPRPTPGVDDDRRAGVGVADQIGVLLESRNGEHLEHGAHGERLYHAGVGGGGGPHPLCSPIRAPTDLPPDRLQQTHVVLAPRHLDHHAVGRHRRGHAVNAPGS